MDLLKKIPKKVIQDFVIHRLGLFEGSSYDLIEMSSKKPYPPTFINYLLQRFT